MVENTISRVGDDEADMAMKVPWADPTDSKSLGYMSAVCFLFGRNIYDSLGIPIGSYSG